MNYWLIFLGGLTTGGLSCLALQGGLLASAMVENEEEGAAKKDRLRAIILFLGAKLLVYTVLGLFLGWLGTTLSPSPKFFGYMNLFIAFFMLGVAAETLKIHPVFRYFLITPPKFLRVYIRKVSKNQGDFAAFLLGVLTVLIPCGVTQAMMVLAVGSASAASGMLIMFFFVLGTIPIFFILGYFATALSQMYHRFFTRLVAVLLIVLAIYTFNNGLKLLGARINLNLASGRAESQMAAAVVEGGVQKITVKVNDRYGYQPARIKLQKGIPTVLTVQGDNARGCVRAFVIPDLGIQKIVPVYDAIAVNFTPTRPGKLYFTCSMGMYYGEFIVE